LRWKDDATAARSRRAVELNNAGMLQHTVDKQRASEYKTLRIDQSANQSKRIYTVRRTL